MAQRVKAIPDGYHTITPAMTVRNAARAAEDARWVEKDLQTLKHLLEGT